MMEKRGDEILFRVFGYVNLKNEKLVGPGVPTKILSPKIGEKIEEKTETKEKDQKAHLNS